MSANPETRFPLIVAICAAIILWTCLFAALRRFG